MDDDRTEQLERWRSSRETGVRSARRATTWTAAALIATVAATTGYLAHAIPVSGGGGSGTTTGTSQTGKSGAVTSHAPVVGGGPVVTSGGSGVTAGSGGSGWRDN